MAERRRARLLPARERGRVPITGKGVAGAAAFAVAMFASVATSSAARGAWAGNVHRASAAAQQQSSWFGRSRDSAVAFDLSRSGHNITHFMLLPPTGTTDRPICPGLPLLSLTDVTATVKGGRIVHHGHQGLSGRLRQRHAAGQFMLGSCTLHWKANRVHRVPQARDGKWTGTLSSGASVSFNVVGRGELIKPINGGSPPMFGGNFGSCAGLTFGGALISPTGSFTLRFEDQRPPPLGATGSGSFSGSQLVTGTVQGTESCASPRLTWTAHG